jgi:hypothetical protein
MAVVVTIQIKEVLGKSNLPKIKTTPILNLDFLYGFADVIM